MRNRRSAAQTSRRPSGRRDLAFGEPSVAPHWIYAIAIGAFQEAFPLSALFLNARFQVTETDDRLLLHVCRIDLRFSLRVLCSDAWSIGLGEGEFAAVVLLAAGVLGMPLSRQPADRWQSAVALIPLGHGRFTFPCVTGTAVGVSSVARERGLLHGHATNLCGVAAHHCAALLRLAFDSLGRVST